MDAIKITIESNAEEASKTFEDLAKAFGDADTQANDLRKDIKNLKTQIYQMTPGTEEYAQALVKLGDKMNTLGDIQRDLKASSGGLDTVFQTSTTALASFASGVSAASGIVALFGGNNEELAKTFVKLQAVMSIATGLKGFAGISKYTDSAIASLAAFIAKMKVSAAAVNQDTAAKTKNIAATQAMNAANAKAATGAGAATGAIGKMTTATKGLSAAIKSTLTSIAGWVAAIAGVIAIIKAVNKSKQEGIDAERAYSKAMTDTIDDIRARIDAEEDLLTQVKMYGDYLRSLGFTEEDAANAKEEYVKSLKDEKQAELEKNMEIEKSIKWYNQSWILIKNGFKSRRELRNAIKAEADEVQNLNKVYQQLVTGDYVSKMKSQLKELEDSYEVSVAEGTSTVVDSLYAKIDKLREAINGLYSYQGRSRVSLTEAQQKQKTEWEDEIYAIEQRIKVIQAGVRKTNREEAKKTFESIKADEATIMEAITNGVSDLINDANDRLSEIDELAVDDAQRLGMVFQEYADIMRTGFNSDAKKVLSEKIDELEKEWTKGGKELSKAQKNVLANLRSSLDAAEKTYSEGIDSFLRTLTTKVLHLPADSNIINQVTNAFKELANKDDVKAINEFVENFKEQVSKLGDAFKNGELTSEQYGEALNNLLKKYGEKTDDFVAKIPGLLEDAVKNTGLTGEEAEAACDAMEEFLTKLFYLPPSYLKNVKDTVLKEKKTEIEKILAGIEATYDKAILDYEVKYAEAKVDVFGKMFKGSSYGIDKQYLEDEKAALDSYYTSLISQYGRLAEEYANDAELHQKYLDLKLQAENNYRKAVADNTVALADLEREEAARKWNTYSNIAAGFSSLGSSIQDYYEYMAEYEAKNEEESRKYKIKGMQAQEFQAVANIAQGITAAIANAFQIPMPAGAIIAALESAAIAASGAVQIATIEKQIKALGGSTGSSSAVNNTSGLIDRVIMGDAQNANQQADLNAMFNGRQMSDTRVYVVEGDINNAQSNTRTAVTQNTF